MMTEAANPKTASISDEPVPEILRMINEEDQTVPGIVAASIPQIAILVDKAVNAVQSGGRIIYCGCGTSGRLAVADTAECPPTYGLSPDIFSAVIAGGTGAIVNASEGCEDSMDKGRETFHEKQITQKDLVIGISASGKAPFVLAFLKEARNAGCSTGAIVNNPDTSMTELADITVTACTGPEVIKGSTRMKAGTAQKLILNMFSTAVCIRLGCVYRNFMVNMKVSNDKLKKRAVDMVTEITGLDAEKAELCLKKSNWSVKEAISSLR